MKPYSRAILVKCTGGVAIAAAIYGVIAGTYSMARWLTFRELRLVSEMETDTRMIAAAVQAVIASSVASISYGFLALLRFRSRRKER